MASRVTKMTREELIWNANDLHRRIEKLMMKNRAHKRNIREMQTKLQILNAKVAMYEGMHNHPVITLPVTPYVPAYGGGGTGDVFPDSHTTVICDRDGSRTVSET